LEGLDRRDQVGTRKTISEVPLLGIRRQHKGLRMLLSQS
jgi:hypothetical protein